MAEEFERAGGEVARDIDAYVSDAFNGTIPLQKLTFAANKVYKKVATKE